MCPGSAWEALTKKIQACDRSTNPQKVGSNPNGEAVFCTKSTANLKDSPRRGTDVHNEIGEIKTTSKLVVCSDPSGDSTC